MLLDHYIEEFCKEAEGRKKRGKGALIGGAIGAAVGATALGLLMRGRSKEIIAQGRKKAVDAARNALFWERNNIMSEPGRRGSLADAIKNFTDKEKKRAAWAAGKQYRKVMKGVMEDAAQEAIFNRNIGALGGGVLGAGAGATILAPRERGHASLGAGGTVLPGGLDKEAGLPNRIGAATLAGWKALTRNKAMGSTASALVEGAAGYGSAGMMASALFPSAAPGIAAASGISGLLAGFSGKTGLMGGIKAIKTGGGSQLAEHLDRTILHRHPNYKNMPKLGKPQSWFKRLKDYTPRQERQKAMRDILALRHPDGSKGFMVGHEQLTNNNRLIDSAIALNRAANGVPQMSWWDAMKEYAKQHVQGVKRIGTSAKQAFKHGDDWTPSKVKKWT